MPSSSTTPATPTQPLKTPPDIKWMLVERATLDGAFQTAAVRLNLSQGRVLRVQRSVAKAQEQVSALTAECARLRAVLDAMDVAIALASEAINPAAGGTVNGWAGRYGKRGALKAFVVEELQARAPEAIGPPELIRLVVARFGLELPLPEQRLTVRQSVRGVLRALRDNEGLVENYEVSVNGRRHAMWRWRQPITLAHLRAQTAEAASDRATDSHEL